MIIKPEFDTAVGHSEMNDAVFMQTGRACGLSNRGRRSCLNQDAIYLSDTDRFYMIADGMGGHRAGEIAGRMAVSCAASLLEKETFADVPAALARAMTAAHEAVRRAGQRDEYKGMGAVMIMAAVAGGCLYTCHVGDVRALLMRGHHLRQITRDHTLVAEMVRMGQLQKQQLYNHPLRNQVLQALGQETELHPELHVRKLRSGDQVLLCSDGLWEAIADEAVADILCSEQSVESKAHGLLRAALANNAQDDVSLILYREA